MTCETCGNELRIGDWPFCPHGPAHMQVMGDDIPGGIEIKHGICNEDGTPKRYYSYSEIRQAAFEAGLTQGGDTPKRNARLEDAKAEKAFRKSEKARKGSYS